MIFINPNELIYGPRLKSECTKQLEQFITASLDAYDQKKRVTLSRNEINETIITVDGIPYFITMILKSIPDFEQFEFDQHTLDLYKKFLLSSQSMGQHLRKELLAAYDINKIKAAFPKLSEEEMSAIRIYTSDFYLAINRLLRENATCNFDNHFLAQLNSNSQNFHTALTTLLQTTQANVGSNEFNCLVFTELLIHTAIACFALSKPISNQPNVFCAVNKNQIDTDKLRGISMIIIGKLTSADIVLYAFNNKIGGISSLDLTASFPSLNIATSIQEELHQLVNTTNSFTKAPGELARYLASIILHDPRIQNFFSETVFRIDVNNNPYINNLISDTSQLTVADCRMQFTQSFYSTSNQPLYQFMSTTHENLITQLSNDIRFGKNIESLSAYPDEQERLIIPNTQIIYESQSTGQTTSPSANKETTLTGTLGCRSLNGLTPDNYNQTLIAARNIIINHIIPIKKQLNPNTHPFFINKTNQKKYHHWIKKIDSCVAFLGNAAQLSDDPACAKTCIELFDFLKKYKTNLLVQDADLKILEKAKNDILAIAPLPKQSSPNKEGFSPGFFIYLGATVAFGALLLAIANNKMTSDSTTDLFYSEKPST